MTYVTRNGEDAILIGDGPLTKTFKEFEVSGERYLVWSKNLRYRMDDDKDGNPVPSDRDILKRN